MKLKSDIIDFKMLIIFQDFITQDNIADYIMQEVNNLINKYIKNNYEESDYYDYKLLYSESNSLGLIHIEKDSLKRGQFCYFKAQITPDPDILEAFNELEERIKIGL